MLVESLSFVTAESPFMNAYSASADSEREADAHLGCSGIAGQQ
eukprot:COSAG02_NODE_417_length_22746_cov_9.074172_10_plen_43_part_00